jgi:rod shape-determining protein MreD
MLSLAILSAKRERRNMDNFAPGKNLKKDTIIALSFLIGFLFTVFPLPMSLQRFRPAWMVIILFAWILNLSNRRGLFLAWGMGFLLDLLNNTIFGLHALVLLIMVYIILKFREKIILLGFWGKAFLFFAIIVFYQLLLNETALSFLHFWASFCYLLSAFFSGMLVSFLTGVIEISF